MLLQKVRIWAQWFDLSIIIKYFFIEIPVNGLGFFFLGGGLWLIYKVVDWFRKQESGKQYSFNISEINKTKVIITWKKEKLQVWLKEPKEKSFRKPRPLLNTPKTFDSQQVLEKHISSLLAQWREY